MGGTPLDLDKDIRAKRSEAANALSERTRTLCLGALALIWGIFVEKKDDKGLNTPLLWKRVLVGIGLSLIIVLICDFLEYISAFQFHRKQAGEKVWNKPDYYAWESRMRFVKLALAAVALIALCVALFGILATPLFGNAREYPYYGTWCGGNSEYGQSTKLQVAESAASGLDVKLALAGDAEWVDCTVLGSDEHNHLKATCGRASINAGPGDHDSDINVTVRIGDNESTRNLSICAN